MIGLLVLTAMISSVGQFVSEANAASTKELCMNITGVELGTKRVLGNAQCDITQSMSQAALGSTWSCSFDGKTAEKLNTIATWVSDGSAEQAQTIFYDIFPQEDLGGYLLKGLNMTAVNADGAFLEVVLDATPHALIPDLMLMTNGYSSKYDGLNITSIQNGGCASQK